MLRRLTLLVLTLCGGLLLIGAMLWAPVLYGRWKTHDDSRVVVIPVTEERYDAPAAVNAFFACADINTVGSHERGDTHTIYFERRPWTGVVVIRGQRVDCRGQYVEPTSLGDLAPGESKSFTIEVQPQKGGQ